LSEAKFTGSESYIAHQKSNLKIKNKAYELSRD